MYLDVLIMQMKMSKDFVKIAPVVFVSDALLENIGTIILLMLMNLKEAIWKIKLVYLKIKLRY